MEDVPRFCEFFFVLFLSYFSVAAHGIKQGEALARLNVAKLQEKSSIDTSDFRTVVNKAKVLHSGSKETDEILRLTGQPSVDFSQYGGYITVNQYAGRALYYYFVEAEDSRIRSLPLVLWLNGGPGCSSLLGAMTELGPFRVQSDGRSLYHNEFAWNKVANVLFLEAPAGTGFSYSNSSSDYKTSGDRRTAEDNYAFLLNWFERFPEYKGRNFYITGESYAGHYVPQLANIIHRQNQKSKNVIINLKGIMVGNAVINDETDTTGMIDYWESHAIISEEIAITIEENCDFSPNKTLSKKCIAAYKGAWEYFEYIDVYDIYAPLCHSNLNIHPKSSSVMSYDPCTEDYLYAYLNQPAAQKAMHANVTNLKYEWSECSNVLDNWIDSPSTIIPLLQELMANQISVWIFR